MGKRWRMPTEEEFKELVDYCHGSWTEENGIPGYKFTSVKTLASVFLPASGYRAADFLSCRGSLCFYWSSSLRPSSYDVGAYSLYVVSGDCYVDDYRRADGLTVRAVCP